MGNALHNMLTTGQHQCVYKLTDEFFGSNKRNLASVEGVDFNTFQSNSYTSKQNSINVSPQIRQNSTQQQSPQRAVTNIYDGFNVNYRFTGRVKWNSSLRKAAAEFIAGDVMRKLGSNSRDLYDCLLEKAKSELMERGY